MTTMRMTKKKGWFWLFFAMPSMRSWLMLMICGAAFSPAVYPEQVGGPKLGPDVLQQGRGEPNPLRQYFQEYPVKPGVPKEPSATFEVERKPKPTIPLKPGLKIDVKGFRFTGLAEVSQQQLQAVVAKHIGPGHAFDDLEAAVGEVAEYLRAQGYFLAQAYLPKQKIRDGIIEIAILIGQIGEVKVEPENQAVVSQSTVDSILSALPPGTVIREGNVERALFLLGDLRGLSVHSVMQPGKKNGTADLVVKLSPGKSFEYSADLDNMGSEFTGRYRAGASATWNNPLGRGDSLSARTIFSANAEQALGRGLAFGRMSYLIPAGPYGTKLGVAYTRLNYEITSPIFNQLGLSGHANVVSAYVLHPIIRGRNLNLFATFGYDWRNQVDTNPAIINPGDDRTGILNFNVGNASLVGDSRDGFLGGGINSFSATLTAGSLDIATSFQKRVDESNIGHRTNGSYQKGNFSFARLQQISGPFLGFLSLSGQVASKNLNASEKVSLGGPAAVRAYGIGEAPSDEMVMLTTELRFSLPKPDLIPGDLIGSAFMDTAWGRLFKDPLLTTLNNTQNRTGVGLGLTWGRPDDFLIKGFASWRLTEQSTTGTSTGFPQVYFSLSKFF